jgi:hypothetical protein
MDVKWDLGRILCKLGPGLQTTNALVCAFSITAIAVDRWHFIVNQGKDKKLLMSISIFLIWAVSFLTAVPSFIVNDEKVFQLKSTKEVLYVVCEEIWFDLSFKYIYSIVVVLFQYVLPVIIIASTNYKICSFLHFHVASLYSHKFKRGFQREDENKAQIVHESLVMNDKSVIVAKQNSFYDDGDYSSSYERSASTTVIRTGSKKFTKSKNLLLLVSLCFAFCWLPLILLNICLDFLPALKNLDGMEMASVYLIGHLVAVSSCCMNPILYGLENTNFKNEIGYMVSKILGRPIADEAACVNTMNVSKENETARESRRKRHNSSVRKPAGTQNLNML